MNDIMVSLAFAFILEGRSPETGERVWRESTFIGLRRAFANAGDLRPNASHRFENRNHITTTCRTEESLIKHLRALYVQFSCGSGVFIYSRHLWWGQVRANVEMRCHSFIGS